MKKGILAVVLLLLLTVGGGLYFLYSNLDGLVKTAIETYGSQATQTAVRVERVEIRLGEGSAAIRGLEIANPPGFTAPLAFSLGEIATRIDLGSVGEEVVVIEQIEVLAPQIFFELNQTGVINLEELKGRLPSAPAPGSDGSVAQAPDPQEADTLRLLIRRLLFRDGQIHANLVPFQKDYALKLPQIELTNLGGAGGMTPTEVSARVVEMLSERAMAELEKQGLDQYRQQLEAEANRRLDAEKRKLEEEIKRKIEAEVGKEMGDKLKKLLDY